MRYKLVVAGLLANISVPAICCDITKVTDHETSCSLPFGGHGAYMNGFNAVLPGDSDTHVYLLFKKSNVATGDDCGPSGDNYGVWQCDKDGNSSKWVAGCLDANQSPTPCKFVSCDDALEVWIATAGTDPTTVPAYCYPCASGNSCLTPYPD